VTIVSHRPADFSRTDFVGRAFGTLGDSVDVSVFVPVAVMGSVTVTVVEVVDVVTVLERLVAAPGTMGVRMIDVLAVGAAIAFVPVTVVRNVCVTLVHVVNVVAVDDRGVTAVGTMGVLVILVGGVGVRHAWTASRACRIAWSAMCDT
jgi:hypothetical protein